MSKKQACIFSVIILIVNLLVIWFKDNIFILDYFVLKFALFIIAIICLAYSVKGKYKAPIIITILSFILPFILFFLPLREMRANLEFNLFLKYRLDAIEMIKNNELKTDDGLTYLPKKYCFTSVDCEAVTYQNDDDQMIGFFVSRGFVNTGSTEIIYSTGGEKLIKKVLYKTIPDDLYIKKLKTNWYYVVTYY